MVGLRVYIGGSELESTKSLGQVRKHWNASVIVYTLFVGTRNKNLFYRDLNLILR